MVTGNTNTKFGVDTINSLPATKFLKRIRNQDVCKILVTGSDYFRRNYRNIC